MLTSSPLEPLIRSLLVILCAAGASLTRSAEASPPATAAFETAAQIDAYMTQTRATLHLKDDHRLPDPAPDAECDGGSSSLQIWTADTSAGAPIVQTQFGSTPVCGDGEWTVRQFYHRGRLIYTEYIFPPYARSMDLGSARGWYNQSGELIQLIDGPLPAAALLTTDQLRDWIKGCLHDYCS